jgi:hypothetical protein
MKLYLLETMEYIIVKVRDSNSDSLTSWMTQHTGPGESLDTVHLYSLIQPLLSYLYMEEGIKEDSPALLAKVI